MRQNAMTKKFIVNIEEKLCRGFEVEAETMEEAQEIATKKYNSEEFVLTADDKGTDAEMQIIETNDKGEEAEVFMN